MNAELSEAVSRIREIPPVTPELLETSANIIDELRRHVNLGKSEEYEQVANSLRTAAQIYHLRASAVPKLTG